jgi:hypothetical protein
MLPYTLDPDWYRLTWYGEQRPAVPDKRPSLAVRIGLSAALIALTLVVLGRVV